MDKPVSYELAKLLKEKKFDIPTFYYYENEKLVEPYLENGSSTDTDFRVDLSDLKELFNKWSKKVSAPTIAEVVCWIYSKYDIWIEVNLAIYEDFRYTLMKNSNLKILHKMSDANFKTPEEAYESAIEYVLKEVIN
jgi:hypothetical protein